MKDPKEKWKVPGWSIEEMKDKANIFFGGRHRRNENMDISEPRGDGSMLGEVGGQFEDEVLDKNQIENSKREAFRGRGSPLEWRRVPKSKKYKIRKWGEDCWARIFALCREYNLQRLQRMDEESTEEEEMKQQQRTNKENQIKRKNGR